MIKTRFFIPLFFIFLSVILFLPADVSASEDEYQLEAIDILNYSMPNDGIMTQVITNNSSVIRFNVPFTYATYFWDILVSCSDPISSLEIVGNSSSVFLTVVHVEGNIYRAYGRAGSIPFATNNIGVRVGTSTSANFSVNFLKFDAYTIINAGVADYGEMKISPDEDSNFEGTWRRMSSPDSPLFVGFYYFGAPQFTQYRANLSCVNWREYDYVDFFFEIRSADIYTISAYIDTDHGFRYIPFELSWLDGSAIDKNEYIGSGSTNVVPSQNNYSIILRAFIPRETVLQGSFHVLIEGNYQAAGSGCVLYSTTGYYTTSVPDPYMVKLDSIESAIKESLSATDEQQEAASDFKESMLAQKDQISSSQSEINSVSKPSSGDLGMMASPDTVLDSSGMSALTRVITPITSNRLVLAILTLMSSLALISYVFFGKKR